MAAATTISVDQLTPSPASPATRIFHSPTTSFYIVAMMGFKTRLDVDIIKQGLRQTLLKHPRFSSKLVLDDNKKVGENGWIPTSVNLEEHVIAPDLDPEVVLDHNPDQFVEAYISNMTTIPLDLSKPLWDLHILNVKTSDAEAVAVLRVHHAVGDGASLISLLLACTQKTSDPEALPTLPESKKRSADSSTNVSKLWRVFVTVWSALTLIWNSFADFILFIATILFLKDTETPIKGASGVGHNTKLFVHRTISLDQVKFIKNAMNMTINDVIFGVTQAGLSQYINRRHCQIEEDGGKKRNYVSKRIRLRAIVMVNLRPAKSIQDMSDMMAKDSKSKWGNLIGRIILPLTIALHDDPLDYVRKAKATIDRKKHSFGVIWASKCSKFILKTLGVKAAVSAFHRMLLGTTFVFSNVVGPMEEISFYGHPLVYLAPSAYGLPHALTIHVQSYMNKMTIVLAVDPNVIPDPHRLLDDMEESLKLIREAVVKQGSTNIEVV